MDIIKWWGREQDARRDPWGKQEEAGRQAWAETIRGCRPCGPRGHKLETEPAREPVVDLNVKGLGGVGSARTAPETLGWRRSRRTGRPGNVRKRDLLGLFDSAKNYRGSKNTVIS